MQRMWCPLRVTQATAHSSVVRAQGGIRCERDAPAEDGPYVPLPGEGNIDAAAVTQPCAGEWGVARQHIPFKAELHIDRIDQASRRGVDCVAGVAPQVGCSRIQADVADQVLRTRCRVDKVGIHAGVVGRGLQKKALCVGGGAG